LSIHTNNAYSYTNISSHFTNYTALLESLYRTPISVSCIVHQFFEFSFQSPRLAYQIVYTINVTTTILTLSQFLCLLYSFVYPQAFYTSFPFSFCVLQVVPLFVLLLQLF